MPLHGTDCQAALVSELHWLHRGQQKDCPFTAHPPGFIYLTAPSFQWHDYVLWQLHFELRIPLLSCPIPSGRSKAFVFAWWGFSFFDAMPYQQTQNALNLNTPTLLSSCSVKDKHPAFFLLLQMPYATTGEFICDSMSNGLIEMGGWGRGCCQQSTGLRQFAAPEITSLHSFVAAMSASHICSVVQWISEC